MINNIELFNVAVAEVFGRCYKSFPIPINVEVIELSHLIQETIDSECELENNVRSHEYEISRATVNWLIDADYLWSRNATNNSFNGLVLTPKGLEVLNSIPSGLENKTTLGEKLGEGAKEIGKDATLDIVKSTLAYGAALVFGA